MKIGKNNNEEPRIKREETLIKTPRKPKWLEQRTLNDKRTFTKPLPKPKTPKQKQVRLKGITQKQKDVYDFIVAFRLQHNESPTVQRIADVFEITLNAAQSRLNALVEHGYITKSHKKCSIQIIDRKSVLSSVTQ